MTHHVFASDRPAGQLDAAPRSRVWLLLVATAVWLLVYVALGWQLWTSGVDLSDPISLLLVILAFVFGVIVAVGWFRHGAGWWRGRQIGVTQRVTQPRLRIEDLLALTPSEFEEFVAQDVFAKMGYAVVNTPDVKDNGIDVLITDRSGNQAVVQCKRYQGTVGEEVVRDLMGTMQHIQAAHGFLVTTGEISSAARKWAHDKPLTLIDGRRLLELASPA